MSNILCQECGKKRDLIVLNEGFLGMRTRYICKECKDSEDSFKGGFWLFAILAFVIYMVFFR